MLVLPNIIRQVPISASTGVKEDGLSSCTNTLSLEIPPRLNTHAVAVVPIFAPIITLMDCRSVIIPEFTKPTTITVVAEELWIIAVTPRPVKNPASLFLVSLASIFLRPSPALRSRASPIMLIPNRKRQSPPIRASKSKMFM